MKASKLSAKITRHAINSLLYVLHPYLVAQYWRTLRRFPDIAVPRDVNEKMLWRKLFDRNPDFVTFSDKLLAKEYVRQRHPDLAQSPVLWSGTDLHDLPKDTLRPIAGGSGRRRRSASSSLGPPRRFHARWRRGFGNPFGRRSYRRRWTARMKSSPRAP